MFCHRVRLATAMVVLLLISFWAPVELVRFELDQLAEKEKIWNAAAIKEAAIQQMSRFKNDLKPENYIDNAVAQIEKEYAARQGSSVFVPDGESYLKFLDEKLRDDYGLKPLFISWGNHDFSQSAAMIAPEMKVGDNDRSEFIELVNKMVLKDILSFFSSSEELRINLMIESWRIKAAQAGFVDLFEYFRQGYQKFFSSYFINCPPPNQTGKYLIDRFNFQFLYFCSRVTLVEGKFCGLAAIGILESDINLEKLQSKTLQAQAGRVYESRRHLLPPGHEGSGYGFVFTDRKTILNDTVPIELETLKKNQNRLKKALTDKFSGNIAVELKEAFHETLSQQGIFIGFFLRFLVLVLFALWARLSFYGFHFKLELRRKFLVLMAIVLLPPAIISSFFSHMIARKEHDLLLSSGRNRLTIRLDMFENLLNEAKNRQSFNNLAVKEMLTGFIQANNLNRLNIKGLEPFYKYNIDSCLIYLKNGDLASFADFFVPNEADTMEVGNSARFLDALGVLERNSRAAAGHLKRSQITEGMVEGFFEMLDEVSIMGQEGLATPRLVKTNPMFRSHYFLLPDLKTDPLRAKASVILGSKLKNGVFELLRNTDGFPQRLFNEIAPDYSLQIAVGERNSAEFEQVHFCGDSRFWDFFTELFRNVSPSGSSGSSMIQNASGTELVVWRLFAESPLMFAGRCQINPASREKMLFSMLPLGLLAFSLLSLLILSEMANNLFLPPISALNYAAARILAENDFQTKVHVENNDEFDQMGSAFNHMTRGLLQRQHLSRFVSGRLVENLSAAESSGQRLSEELEVTVLCSDLRDFTRITETNSAETVVETLNDYFTEMEAAIIENQGVIDKFVGDAIVAVFYPDRCDDTAIAATKAALAMRQSLNKFNLARQKKALFCLENGIGIVTGVAISGNLGVPGVHMDYSITGKVLRQANELEALSRTADISRIVVDEVSAHRIAAVFSLQPLNPPVKNCLQVVGEIESSS